MNCVIFFLPSYYGTIGSTVIKEDLKTLEYLYKKERNSKVKRRLKNTTNNLF